VWRRLYKVSPYIIIDEQVLFILQEFSEVFSGRPGTTPLIEHHVELTDKTPVIVKQYPIPDANRQDVENEIQDMIMAGVIDKVFNKNKKNVLILMSAYIDFNVNRRSFYTTLYKKKQTYFTVLVTNYSN
jgi:hypothetical protein